MIFKNAFVPESLSTSFEIVFKKKATLLNVIILKYREEFIYGYNFMNNTVKDKLFLYSKDFLRAKQSREIVQSTLKILKISKIF